jgi:alpha-tubulin suppressor-like RCC1 family protein
VKELENGEIALEAFTDENPKHKKVRTEYIKSFKTVVWGLDHGLIIDNKDRVFSMGSGNYGKLGHGD